MKNKLTIGIILIIALSALVFNYLKAIEISPEELKGLMGENLGLAVYQPSQGGTGTSTPPSYGQLLLGQSDGSYDLVATSSLGISIGGASGWTDDGTTVRLTTASDNVGIGTVSPNQKLHIAGGNFRSEGTSRTGVSGEPGRWRFYDSSGYLMSFWTTSTDYDNWGLYWDTSGNEMRWMGSGNLRASIDLDDGSGYFQGNVGIGTATPGAKLDINGNVNLNNQHTTSAGGLNPGYYVYKSATTAYGMKLQYTGSEFGTMIFGPNQANRFIGFGKIGAVLEDDDIVEYMRIDLDNGNVGIGTTSPDYKLDVNGTGRFTGLATLANASSTLSTLNTIFDNDGDIGTAGQVLSSTGAVTNWIDVTGTGDVSKVGTPVDNQIGVWTGDGTIEGTAGLTYNGLFLDIDGLTRISGANIDSVFYNTDAKQQSSLIWTNSISQTQGKLIYDYTNNFFEFRDFEHGTGSLLLIETDTGDIGIATSSPEYKLDVWGTGRFTGALNADSNLTVGGTLALGTNNLTMTGSLGATGSRITKGWFTDLEVTNDITIGGTALGSIGPGITGQTPYYASDDNDLTATSTIFIDTNEWVGIATTTPKSTLTVNGDITFATSTQGLVLTSPDGTDYRITVDNSGNLESESSITLGSAIIGSQDNSNEISDMIEDYFKSLSFWQKLILIFK